MTQTVMAWVNLAKLATITATSSEAGLPPENMINEIGAASTAWQSAAGVTNATLTFTFADPGLPIRTIGIFRTNLTTQAQITATITLDGDETWTETLAGPAVGYGQVIFITTSAENADSLTIEIDDPTNPDAFLNVPLVFIGDAWLPAYSASPSSADTWAPEVNRLTTRGGQLYQTELSNARSITFEFAAVDQTQAYAAAREVARLAALGLNVLFILNGDGDYVKYDAVFGPVTNARAFGYLPGASGTRTWGATVTERL
jgi:hypothetical protein